VWIVEINFAGRRFVREVHGRRPTFRLTPRSFGWRHVPLPQTPAA
jgi:hypothetical protein